MPRLDGPVDGVEGPRNSSSVCLRPIPTKPKQRLESSS